MTTDLATDPAESQTPPNPRVAENPLEIADCKYQVSEPCTGNILPL